MNLKTRNILLVIVLGVLDAAIPFFPIFALMLAYVMLEKPAWFYSWIQEIYRSQ